MFQFLIGNVLACHENLVIKCWGDLVSIPYRQCLSKVSRLSIMGQLAKFQFLIGNVLALLNEAHGISKPKSFQFLIGNVLAQLNEEDYIRELSVSIPYRQCLSFE